jgi:hypothetical protein
LPFDYPFVKSEANNEVQEFRGGLNPSKRKYYWKEKIESEFNRQLEAGLIAGPDSIRKGSWNAECA